MRAPRSLAVLRPLLAAPVALFLLVAGCGGAEESSSGSPVATPSASDFPSADGRTLEELAADAAESDLVVQPSGQVFDPGRNRFAFGVFTVERESVPDAAVAIYAARPGGEAEGPFPATAAELETAPAFRSQTTAEDPDAATVVYTADVPMKGKGEWRLMAMFRDDEGGYSTATIPSAVVGRFPEIPDVGEKAPVVHTPTVEDVGDIAEIDTRSPHDTMHDVDFADVVGKKPVVLLFATPALCTSRVCGPVVDIAEEVKRDRGDDAAFIHQEIYTDNDPGKGPNEQVRAFDLPSEPWLFVVDREGRISTRIEGAFSADELEAAIDKVS